MPYRFATDKQDYSDYARGRVLYGLHGHPAYPVRLASEIWQRCTAVLQKQGRSGPYLLYDPCCGSAYLLTTLALLFRPQITTIVGSDVDARALETARRNLGLLSVQGMEQRIDEIRALHHTFGKASHAEALESALRLQDRLFAGQRPGIETHVFEADATDARALACGLARGLGSREIDVLLADLPYGRDSQWKRLQEDGPPSCSPLIQMLDALLDVTSAGTIVALSSDKGQKLAHSDYRRIERFQIGRRQVALLGPHHS